MVSNFDFAGTHGFGNSVSLRDQSLQQPDSQESISSDIDPEDVAARPDLDMPPEPSQCADSRQSSTYTARR